MVLKMGDLVKIVEDLVAKSDGTTEPCTSSASFRFSAGDDLIPKDTLCTFMSGPDDDGSVTLIRGLAGRNLRVKESAVMLVNAFDDCVIDDE